MTRSTETAVNIQATETAALSVAVFFAGEGGIGVSHAACNLIFSCASAGEPKQPVGYQP